MTAPRNKQGSHPEPKTGVKVKKRRKLRSREARLRSSPEHRAWSNAVKDRDGRACRHCGSWEDLVAHHVRSFHDYPLLRYEVSNGLTLCAPCHLEEHRRLSGSAKNGGTVTLGPSPTEPLPTVRPYRASVRTTPKLRSRLVSPRATDRLV